MHNKIEWTECDESDYNVYRPEYTLQIIHNEDDREREAEFYAYAMTNANTSYGSLNIMYQNTVLESYQLVVPDGGRLQIPTPERGYICHNDYGTSPKYSYKYYVLGSCCDCVLAFLYDSQNSDARFAFMHLKDVILFYRSEEERLVFKSFIEGH